MKKSPFPLAIKPKQVYAVTVKHMRDRLKAQCMSHAKNFHIPAQFTFQPFAAEWRIVRAETVEWVEVPKLRPLTAKPTDEPEKTALRIRIGSDSYGTLDPFPPVTVLMDRASIPPDVLQPHENYRSKPDISGRSFPVLICQKPEFKDGFWNLRPGDTSKNAWLMRNEFLKLKAHPLPELGWNFSVRQFLNKWGLWSHDSGYSEDWSSASHQMMPLLQKHDRPDFVLVMPHLLREQQEKFKQSLLKENRLAWLRSHHLENETADEYPFIRVRRSYCNSAIEATITITHIEGLEFGICKRQDCGNSFERTSKQKRLYCSHECAHLANVRKLRAAQRKTAKKGAKRNAKG